MSESGNSCVAWGGRWSRSGSVRYESLRNLNVHLVIGGPPCQGFSPLGKMSPTDHHARLNRLWEEYFKVVGWLKPEAFVIENVPEFLKSGQYIQAKRLAEKLGYKITEGVLNA